MYTINDIKSVLQANTTKQRIVFPEANEQKIQEVAEMLVKDNIAQPILLFTTKAEVPANLSSEIVTIIVDEYSKDEMKSRLLEVRKGKLEEKDADPLLLKTNYFGAMMIEMGLADGMVCGLTFTTADTLRPALQIVKTAPGYSLASSVFLMSKGSENYIFTDCALNISPDSKQLAEIAKMAGDFAKDMDVAKPQVALLSYSTAGSGAGPDVDLVKEAVKLMGEDSSITFDFDGEMQFDSAYDKEVRMKKAPNTKLTNERPDVYVFPNISAGNIGYKIAQRMGGFETAGPFILGLNKPINDLSRGATLMDIYNTAIVTALQASKIKK